MVELGVWVLLLVIHWMRVVTWLKESVQPEKHMLVFHRFTIRTRGTQLQGDGKDCAPLSLKEWEVRPACLAIFFLELEWSEVLAPGDAWNLSSEGKGVGSFVRLVSPAEGVSALALTHFN